MDDAIEILKELFECYCENNNIDVDKVDFMTHIIVSFVWIQKLLNSQVSTDSNDFKEKRKRSFNFDSNKFKQIFKNEDFDKLEEEEVMKNEEDCLKLDEKDDYIKKLEHENKQLIENVLSLKLHIETIDDLNSQLHIDADTKQKENDKYVGLFKYSLNSILLPKLLFSLRKIITSNNKLKSENDEFKLTINDLTNQNNSLRESLNQSDSERKLFENSIDKTLGEQVKFFCIY
jgi:hypothetical protein